ncbi:MAG TPA: STAS domain-containing protein [Acidimicrobiales bacterium]|nr:STAS domain-containing protein [Acidimicrobiales bacterium]
MTHEPFSSGPSTARESPAASLRVSTTRDDDGGVVTVTPVGDLDLHTTDQLSDELEGVMAGDPVARIRLDASLLRFVDSAGLRCLLTTRTLAEARGIRFGVVAPSRALQRVLEMTGLHDLVDRDA